MDFVQRIYAVVREAANADETKELIQQTIFERWHTGYIAKSHAGQDEFGNEWDPLAPSTLAEKTLSPSKRVNRSTQWQKRYNSLVRQLRAAGMSSKDAQAKAGSLAWGSMMNAPQATPINIDTTRLERSLSPEGSEDSIRTMGNPMELGTDVEYAKYVNASRRILPTPSEAAVWLRDAAREIRGKIMGDIE